MKKSVSQLNVAKGEDTVAKIAVEKKNETILRHGVVFVINFVVTLVIAVLTSMHCEF